MTRHIVLTIWCTLLLVGQAGAEPTPTHATLDRQQGANGATVSLSHSRASVDEIDFGLGRLDVYGERLVHRAVSAYAQLNLVQGVGLDGASTSLSNTELGIAQRIRRGRIHYVAHAGVVLPTGVNSEESGDARVAQAFASYGRFTDQVATVEDVTWARFAVSPVVQDGRWFARADLGIDIPVFAPDQLAQPVWRVQPETQLRINASLGVVLGPLFVAGDVATLAARDGVPMRDTPARKSLASTAAVTVGGAGSRWTHSLTIAAPLTGDARGRLWSVTAGFSGAY